LTGHQGGFQLSFSKGLLQVPIGWSLRFIFRSRKPDKLPGCSVGAFLEHIVKEIPGDPFQQVT
jgi:hypothetical protein